MEPFIKHRGIVAAIDRVNVDTDQIIPKQFLKRIERTGFGEFLFYDWRYLEDGSPDPDFALNLARYEGATVLLARNNFGCGSSREHAPWALLDYGFRCIIAPSFADIFYNNCFQNGILPIRLSEQEVSGLFSRCGENEGYELAIDLEASRITDDLGLSLEFEIDPYRQNCLLRGLDEIAQTLLQEDKIVAFESGRSHG